MPAIPLDVPIGGSIGPITTPEIVIPTIPVNLGTTGFVGPINIPIIGIASPGLLNTISGWLNTSPLTNIGTQLSNFLSQRAGP
jgi:hypothetical protein